MNAHQQGRSFWRHPAVKAVQFVLLVSGVFFLLGFLGLMMTGAGHGTAYFIAVMTAPFLGGEPLAESRFFEQMGSLAGSFGSILFWPSVALLVACRKCRPCAFATAALLMIHYGGVIWLQFGVGSEWAYVRQVWPLAVPWIAVYVGMNLWFWRLLLPHLPKTRELR